MRWFRRLVVALERQSELMAEQLAFQRQREADSRLDNEAAVAAAERQTATVQRLGELQQRALDEQARYHDDQRKHMTECALRYHREVGGAAIVEPIKH